MSYFIVVCLYSLFLPIKFVFIRNLSFDQIMAYYRLHESVLIVLSYRVL